MAVRIDASGEYYSASDGLPSSTVWSYTLWVYLAVDRNDYSEIVSFGPNDNSVSTGLDGTTLRVYPLDFGSTALTTATWYQVAVVVNGSALDLYVGAEGAGLTKQSSASYVATTPSSLRIGDYHGGGYFWNGRIANLKMWSAALNQSEIETELASYTITRTSGILRAHKFIVAETTDYSGNGNTLSVTGSPTTEDGPATLDAAGTSAPAGHASGTGAASAPSVRVSPSAGHGSGGGAASAPTVRVSPSAGHASGSGSAGQPTVTTSQPAAAGHASGTGAAGAPAVSVSVNAGHASGSGAAHQPTVTADGATSAPAGHAAGSGTAHQPTVTTSQPAAAGHASGTGAAHAPTVTIGPAAGHASGAGAAASPAAGVAPVAGHAAGAGAALAPTVSTSGSTVDPAAGHASGAGVAYQPTVLTVSAPTGGSWWSLVSILQEARDPTFSRRDEQVACPNDGEPYTTGPDGRLFCRFDGYRPDGIFV